MDKMTEKEQRDLEKLKTADDYVYAIRVVSEVVCGTKKADKKIDDTLLMLVDALYEKFKYIINISKPYRKKQSLFSKISDYFTIRRLNKEQKKENKAKAREQQQVAPQEPVGQVNSLSPAPAIPQTKVEVIDKAPVKEITENEEQNDDVMKF